MTEENKNGETPKEEAGKEAATKEDLEKMREEIMRKKAAGEELGNATQLDGNATKPNLREEARQAFPGLEQMGYLKKDNDPKPQN